MPHEPTADLAAIQEEVGAWHREQFPDVPLEAIRDKIECEVREYFYARTMYLARRDAPNARALEDEAADILLTLLGDLERLPHVRGRAVFAKALARKWAEVRQRDYRGRS